MPNSYTIYLTREKDRRKFGTEVVHVSAGEALARQICRCYNALGASVKLVSKIGNLTKCETFSVAGYRKLCGLEASC